MKTSPAKGPYRLYESHDKIVGTFRMNELSDFIVPPFLEENLDFDMHDRSTLDDDCVNAHKIIA